MLESCNHDVVPIYLVPPVGCGHESLIGRR
jgi:hypothetical protein